MKRKPEGTSEPVNRSNPYHWSEPEFTSKPCEKSEPPLSRKPEEASEPSSLEGWLPKRLLGGKILTTGAAGEVIAWSPPPANGFSKNSANPLDKAS